MLKKARTANGEQININQQLYFSPQTKSTVTHILIVQLKKKRQKVQMFTFIKILSQFPPHRILLNILKKLRKQNTNTLS